VTQNIKLDRQTESTIQSKNYHIYVGKGSK